MKKEVETTLELAVAKVAEDTNNMVEVQMEKMEQQTAHLQNIVKENADNLWADFKEQTEKIADMFTTMVTKSNETNNSVTAIMHMMNKQQEQCGVLNQMNQQFYRQQMNNTYVPTLPVAYPYYQAQQMVM
eukprot:7639101-Ditylum_brightwellii.AAC.1